jgi:hypothetical protein
LKAGKKGKKHNRPSKEGVQSLCQQYSKARKKVPVIGFSALFFAEAELCFLGFIWRVILVLVQPRMGFSD